MTASIDPEGGAVADVTAGAPHPASIRAARLIGSALDDVASAIDQATDELGQLDAVDGDGDHGLGMRLGAHAARNAATATIEQGGGAGSVLHAAADAWSDAADGVSAVIWPSMLHALADRLGDVEPVTAAAVAEGVQAAQLAVVRLGHAAPGEKTVLDAIIPFSEELRERVAEGLPLAEAWAHAAGVAEEAAQETAALVAAHGHTAGAAAGTPDPGAVSFAIIGATVADVLGQHSDPAA